jgi:hypothetical protein
MCLICYDPDFEWDWGVTFIFSYSGHVTHHCPWAPTFLGERHYVTVCGRTLGQAPDQHWTGRCLDCPVVGPETVPVSKLMPKHVHALTPKKVHAIASTTA